MKIIWFAIATALLTACSAPPKRQLPTTPVKFDAVLQSGCLMPEPSEFLSATQKNSILRLHITQTGRVSSAAIIRTSGSQSLDASLAAAASRCTFAPAYLVNVAERKRGDIEDDYTLNVTWSKITTMVGPLRCFLPDYTLAARRAGEEGKVVLHFRVNGDYGTLETRIHPDSTGGVNLRSLSLRAVEACVEHKEVKASITPNAWYSIPFVWKLE
jgi:hypothetical protein